MALCCEGEAPLLIVERKRLFGYWEGIEAEEKAASGQWLATWGGHSWISMNENSLQLYQYCNVAKAVKGCTSAGFAGRVL